MFTQSSKSKNPGHNRSLERGIEILRSFRPGADLLGNGEISDRTGLSRATVSRLTQTLVSTGMLEHDIQQRAYRLAPPVLSLAHAMLSGSPVLQEVAPLMRKVAEKLKINVGFAVADRDEMVYLESIRYNRKLAFRNVVAGQRVPIELTSLGRAWLAVIPDSQKIELYSLFEKRRSSNWDSLNQDIENAIKNVRAVGYCSAAWLPQVVALATPIVIKNQPIYVLNMSVTTLSSIDSVSQELSTPLLNLANQLRERIINLSQYD